MSHVADVYVRNKYVEPAHLSAQYDVSSGRHRPAYVEYSLIHIESTTQLMLYGANWTHGDNTSTDMVVMHRHNVDTSSNPAASVFLLKRSPVVRTHACQVVCHRSLHRRFLTCHRRCTQRPPSMWSHGSVTLNSDTLTLNHLVRRGHCYRILSSEVGSSSQNHGDSNHCWSNRPGWHWPYRDLALHSLRPD